MVFKALLVFHGQEKLRHGNILLTYIQFAFFMISLLFVWEIGY